MLSILAFCIAVVFTLISKDTARGRLGYFFKLMLYMAVGSFVAGWVMSAIPW